MGMDQDIEKTVDSAVRSTSPFGPAADEMQYDTVDRETQEWQRIRRAVAFRMPNGDELLVLKCVDCPDPNCGLPVGLALVTGATIGYGAHHMGCVGMEGRQQFDADDNWIGD